MVEVVCIYAVQHGHHQLNVSLEDMKSVQCNLESDF